MSTLVLATVHAAFLELLLKHSLGPLAQVPVCFHLLVLADSFEAASRERRGWVEGDFGN